MRYLTQISVIIVSLVFLYTLNFKSFVTFNFYWNQTEIAELFCINKEKPQLKCNGKCHLNTILSETDTKSDVPFSQNNTEYNLDLIFYVVNSETTQNKPKSNKNNWFTYSESPIERDISISSPPPKV